MSLIAIEKELNWDLYADNYSDWIETQLKSFRRDAWLDEIKRVLGDKENLRILDVGTGPGFFPIILSSLQFHVTGIDYSNKMIDVARNNLSLYDANAELLQMNAEELRFPDEMFDAIIARNITYALSNPENAYREWLRVLKKSGKLIIYDHNWFYFLCNKKENRKVLSYLKQYHQNTGRKHETYELEVQKFYSHIISRPMTHRNRPNWDIMFFLQQHIEQVSVSFDLTRKLFSEKELFDNSPTPMFVLEVKK